MTNSGDRQSIQRIGSFWFVVLRVWVHGGLASLLLNLVRQYIMTGARGRCIASHYTRCQKQRGRGRAKVLLTFGKHASDAQVPALEDSLTPRIPQVWD